MSSVFDMKTCIADEQAAISANNISGVHDVYCSCYI